MTSSNLPDIMPIILSILAFKISFEQLTESFVSLSFRLLRGGDSHAAEGFGSEAISGSAKVGRDRSVPWFDGASNGFVVSNWVNSFVELFDGGGFGPGLLSMLAHFSKVIMRFFGSGKYTGAMSLVNLAFRWGHFEVPR